MVGIRLFGGGFLKNDSERTERPLTGLRGIRQLIWRGHMWLGKLFRKNRSANRDFSIRNAEMLLRTQISLSHGHPNPLRLFTLGEIHEATRSFDPSRRLGSRSFRFYWGALDDRKLIVENWNREPTDLFDDRLAEAIVTGTVVLCNTRHRNVVKLLGCCLEAALPLPVYEFVPNGTLEAAMRRWSATGAPPLSARLQIAIDVGDALAYLHSYSSQPIVHQDVRGANIVFDEGYTAKLAGFTFSAPIDMGNTQVQVREDPIFGTAVSIDPECGTTGVVTEKVDTYAFGLLLLELLIGVRYCNSLLGQVLVGEGDREYSPVLERVESADVEEAREEKRLTLKDACVAKLVADASVMGGAEGKADHIRALAELFLRCARPRGEERPSMKEVVDELRRIRRVGFSYQISGVKDWTDLWPVPLGTSPW